MREYINKIICGNTLDVLKKITSGFVDTVITSPPYFGLRDYGKETVTILDEKKGCKHNFETEQIKNPMDRGGKGQHDAGGIVGKMGDKTLSKVEQGFCSKCGAWKGQLGLEPSLELYLKHMLQITKELHRVLKKTGVMYWNHGDCYGGSATGSLPNPNKNFRSLRTQEAQMVGQEAIKQGPEKYKKDFAKCLMLQNYRLILKMIDEQGWILRNTIIWHKPNHMPSCLSPNIEVYIQSENGVIAPHTLGEIINWNIQNLKILTPTGWKKIKHIWKVKGEEYLKFQFGTSGEVVCSLDHKFPISHDNRRRRYEIKSAKDLREDKHRLLDRLLFIPIGRFLDGKYEEIKTLKVSKIEKIKKEKELIDIEVEGGLFLINGGLISHNSVKDRYANSYEPVYMLVKSKKYFFDLNSVRVKLESNLRDIARMEEHGRFLNPVKMGYDSKYKEFKRPITSFNYRVREAKKEHFGIIGVKSNEEEMERYDKQGRIREKYPIEEERKRAVEDEGKIGSAQRIESFFHKYRGVTNPGGKNPGDLWEIPTQPFSESHFATFPEKLIEPMIKSSCPEHICNRCGEARERIIKPSEEYVKYLGSWTEDTDKSNELRKEIGFQSNTKKASLTAQYNTIGWTECNCDNKEYEPGIVLDPFMGSGTTALVALKLNRRFIGIDINQKYIDMAYKRIKPYLEQTKLTDLKGN